jgi:hypothetical protein
LIALVVGIMVFGVLVPTLCAIIIPHLISARDQDDCQQSGDEPPGNTPAAIANTNTPEVEQSWPGIDYAIPSSYLSPIPHFGSWEKVKQNAANLKGPTPKYSLLKIHKWMRENLSLDERAAYKWRTFDQILHDGTYGGCADHALVFGALARACGIPVVWVKTMDVDWILEFTRKGTCKTWRGHVFLEVYLDGKWKLYDTTKSTLRDKYDVKQRILPGYRYAYQKGDNPYELILSLRWELWKKQTREYFKNFDLRRLAGEPGAWSASRVYIAANAPVYIWLTQHCQRLGLDVRASFNTDYDKHLGQAKGHILIVTCLGDQIVLPAKYHTSHLPISTVELVKLVNERGGGLVKRRLKDGTHVLVVYGRSLDAIKYTIDRLALKDMGLKPRHGERK